FPDDWDMDTMFFSENLPPVFRDALAFTGRALDEFLARARRDGFKLIILADKSMYLQSRPQAGNVASSLSRDAAIERLKGLAVARNIPIVDFEAYLESTHRDPAKASFAHDGHWSPAGHLWAAQALYQYIHENPSVCHRN